VSVTVVTLQRDAGYRSSFLLRPPLCGTRDSDGAWQVRCEFGNDRFLSRNSNRIVLNHPERMSDRRLK